MFKDTDFTLRFQPFQLYPQLPEGEGKDKAAFFLANSQRVRPGESEAQRAARRQCVVKAWAQEGLKLKDVYGSMGGKVGNSFDAQRLIWWARQQGKEGVLVDVVYKANHEQGRCLGDRNVLLECAKEAGVDGAEGMLLSNRGIVEVQGQIERYRQLGINAVPVVILEGRYPIYGYPDAEMLEQTFRELIEYGVLCPESLQ